MDQAFIEQLVRDVEAYADTHGGRIYSAIDHPAFDHVAFQHGPERFNPIADNMPAGMTTGLDIGSHWGYFSHMLEGLGLKVTATEILPSYLDFLTRLKSLYGDKFEIWSQSVFEMKGAIKYDVVLALNILHHFIKTEKLHDDLTDFLNRLDCKVMFFQSHSVKEGQMSDAYRNYNPTDFCELIVENVEGFTSYREIARFGSRPIFIVE